MTVKDMVTFGKQSDRVLVSELAQAHRTIKGDSPELDACDRGIGQDGECVE